MGLVDSPIIDRGGRAAGPLVELLIHIRPSNHGKCVKDSSSRWMMMRSPYEVTMVVLHRTGGGGISHRLKETICPGRNQI